ncbi:hypothetical protein CASFOL_030027 [Castilleja foliolosa]|uniref:Uncharacterized protein n=1 Tax=Castilleja foliolosa TaxID=1961234 RepID=A0ABD3CA69_9LAMI
MNVPKDSRNEENIAQHTTEESQESKGESLISNSCSSELNPEQTQVIFNCQQLFIPNTHNIPKHITTFDEKYVLRCLELLHNCALRSAASKVYISPDDKLAIDYPSVTSSPSMINILNSRLVQKSGFIDSNLLEPVFSNLSKSISPPSHKRLISMSSTYTSCSDKSSSSGSASSFQGMLTCTLKDGLPQYTFSADDKSEVYIATLSRSRAGLSDDNVNYEYVYTFCTRKKELEPQSVGTMRVSTSVSLCSDNNSLEIKETRFVLSLSGNDHKDGMQISNHNHNNHRKSRGLTSKVANVFKPSHSYKQRPSVSSAIFEDSQWDPPEDRVCRANRDYYSPNLELAAVILRDVRKNRKEDEQGGWGLKFLKKSGKEASKKTILPSECTSSLNVLVPAGIHGGPKIRCGGPSGLVDRWVSGGRCDCGGWDMGCSLTVLNVGSMIRTNSSCQLDNSSVDLFVQGSKEDVPMFKMANINEGLYYIHFQSTLSSLQSFAIAVAIIHSHSDVLRSKVYRS